MISLSNKNYYKKMAKKFSIAEIVSRLKEVHSDTVILDISTYKDMNTKCRFLDKDFGEWFALPTTVITRKCGHWKRRDQKRKDTNLIKYGCECTFANKNVKEKIKQANLTKYGVENPSQSTKIKEKKNQTCFKHFGVNHPLQNEKIKEKTKQTNLQKYGTENPMQNKNIHGKAEDTNLLKYGVRNVSQNPEISLRAAKSMNYSVVLVHWFSCEEIICVGSYEKEIVEYFNKNQIDYLWQVQTFTMPDGKTYRPDIYLPEQDLWIEIKGYFRDDAEEKWNWFHKEHPNSELWNENKLKAMTIL